MKMAAVALATIALMATFSIIPMITLAIIDITIDVPTFDTCIPLTVPINYAVMSTLLELDLHDTMHHDVTAVVMEAYADWSIM
jgi:hypothetical protein